MWTFLVNSGLTFNLVKINPRLEAHPNFGSTNSLFPKKHLRDSSQSNSAKIKNQLLLLSFLLLLNEFIVVNLIIVLLLIILLNIVEIIYMSSITICKIILLKLAKFTKAMMKITQNFDKFHPFAIIKETFLLLI